jgi:hypothetical protein
MNVRVDAAREHQPATRVDLAAAGHGAANLGHPPVADADVGIGASLRGDDRPAAHDEVERVL